MNPSTPQYPPTAPQIRGVRSLYKTFVLPKSADEDLRRQELILNLLLSGTMIMVTLLLISTLVSYVRAGTNYSGIGPFVLVFVLAVFGGLLSLSRKGFVRIASYLLISLYFAMTMYATWRWSFVLPMIVLGSVMTIVVSSILVSIRFSFFVTALISVSLAFITTLQTHHVIPFDVYWQHDAISVQDVLEMSFIFFLIAGVSWLSNREIENSLRRARSSEAELKTERDGLEARIEERTRELKSLQAEQLARLYREAELGRLSGGIFHDLMNPLNAVIANVEGLERHPERISDVRDYLGKAISASRRMGGFLGTVRKQIQHHVLSERFSANKEMQEAVDLLSYRARETGVFLSLTMKRELSLFGNPLKFHQIALNLISNAIDASELAEQKTVHVTLSKYDNLVCLKVTDHGPGIPDEAKDRIFEAFFTTKDPLSGTGLGLSTTKTIVEKEFGGTVSFTSTINRGTTFTVMLPYSK